MNLIQTFTRTFWLSFTQPSYYRDILRAKPSFSLKFFFAYHLLFALVGTLVLFFSLLQPLNSIVLQLPQTLLQAYPQELEITVSQGVLSTNVSEPYSIPLSRFDHLFSQLDDRILGATTQIPENFLVIDTQADIADFWDYSTFVLLTQNQAAILDEDGSFRVTDFSDVNNFTLNQANLASWLELAQPYLAKFLPLATLFVFLATLFFLPLASGFYLLFFGLLLWLFSRLLKPPLTYRQSIKLGIHMLVIPTTILGLLSFVPHGLPLPFARTFLLLIFSYFVLQNLKSSPPSAAPPPNLSAT